jgi:hypothetical protein
MKDELRKHFKEIQRRVRSLQNGKDTSSNIIKNDHISTDSTDEKLDINSLCQMPDLN